MVKIFYLLWLVSPYCPPGETKLAVFEFKGIGVEKDLTTIVSDLLRVELTGCPRYRVISKEVMQTFLGDTLTVKDMDDVKRKSDSLKAKFAVTGHLTQLGNKIILSASLVDVQSKVTIFTDKLTSATVEDLELVVKRLAEALCTMEKAKTKVTVETITEEEAKPKLRRQSYHTVGLTLGMLYAIGNFYGKKVKKGNEFWYTDEVVLSDDYVKDMKGFGITYFYESPYYMGEVAGKIYTESFSKHWSIKFSGYRFLSLQDFSPYIGGGLGMGWGRRVTGIDSLWSDWSERWRYKVDVEGFDGFLAEIGVGIMLFRTYDFHFILDVKYNIMFADKTVNHFVINFGITYTKRKGGCGF